MTMVPVHTQDVLSKSYSRIAKDLYKSLPEIGSYTKALEILAQAFGYSDHKQVLALASYVPNIRNTPSEYEEIIKNNIKNLSLFDVSAFNYDNLKYLVSFGYEIEPVTEIDTRTIQVLSHFYFREILQDLDKDSKFDCPFKGFKKLISHKVYSLSETEQKRLLALPLPEFFCANNLLKSYSSLSDDFEVLHRAKCYQAIKEATYTGYLITGPGIKMTGEHDKNQVFMSMTGDSIVSQVSIKMLDVLVGNRVKAKDFFITKLDTTPIKLSDFHLRDRPTLAALKKACTDERKKAKMDSKPLSIDEFAKDFDVGHEDLEEEYKSYIKFCKSELKDTLDWIRDEYEIDLGLDSIELKKKYGPNFLIFKLAEEYGEGSTGCITPYSWHCSVRTIDGDILSIAAGHIYYANYEYAPDISDIFIFEDNYTISYGKYASAFRQYLESIQGISKHSWAKPDISDYLDAGPIVFLKDFYRDQAGRSCPGDGIAALNYAVTCISKFLESQILLVSFIDPPQYTFDDENQPSFIRKRQKDDIKAIRKHILGGLAGRSEEIYEFMFIKPQDN
jgi:hypothetical protein